MSRYLALVLTFFAGFFVFAQVRHPGPTALYNPNHVSKIEVLLHPDSLADLLHPDNRWSYHEYPATAIISGNGFVDTVYQVGFRLRGNTSRNAQKKSFKLAFNTFQPGQRYRDVKSLNLNGEHNDPSIMRARVCWELGARGGLPVSRSQHTQLFINGIYHGVYLNLEHINDDWLQLRYGHQSGNLFKCIYPANLGYLSNDPNAYKFTRSDGRRVYDLVNNEISDDYSRLAELIAILNLTPQSELRCALEPIFDIPGYLKTLAFEVVTGHWDNYAFNQNNYYLYDNPETGKFEYLAYDMDNTLGVDWFGIDWASRHVNQWPANQPALPLAQRLLMLPELHEIFRFHILEFSTLAENISFHNLIDQIHQQIAPYAQSDTFRMLDYGFSFQDFNESLNRTTSLLHVQKGIRVFLLQRIQSNRQQILPFNMAPVISEVRIQFSGPAQWHVAAKITDEQTPQVLCEYRINGGPLRTLTLRDDGNHMDRFPGDGTFGGFVNNLLPGDAISWQLIANDPAGRQRTYPCTPLVSAIEAPGPLVINEFMAVNTQTLRDQTGRFEDWIELYNNSPDSVWLGDYFLTDNIDQPTQCACPQEYLSPGAFTLIWASGDPSRGANHCPFGLSARGEFLGLYKIGTGYVELLNFGTQTANISYGRTVDAALSWTFFSNPTPQASNGRLDIKDEIAPAFELWPNPYQESFQIANPLQEDVLITMHNPLGQIIMSKFLSPLTTIELTDHAPSGWRTITLTSSKGSQVFRLMKVW
jgi:spore coat protein H